MVPEAPNAIENVILKSFKIRYLSLIICPPIQAFFLLFGVHSYCQHRQNRQKTVKLSTLISDLQNILEYTASD